MIKNAENGSLQLVIETNAQITERAYKQYLHIEDMIDDIPSDTPKFKLEVALVPVFEALVSASPIAVEHFKKIIIFRFNLRRSTFNNYYKNVENKLIKRI